ncbi:outer membrane protein assembly factor BamB family protein [Mariniblastus fucicola]|uniref:Outer membrane protein assembly factor BamB n=1 Tax=Mariniblastus fucicola TaxID=980251 RepID=A0A5B9P8Y0_9BACT|nr:PQQ-binding-like beta-propeller repeat protein [Mariniblastus fucicola]QEG21382.1 Outer membrane protein assembly factor BamB precursor [Mariniblastus fucicola]
MNFRNLTAIAFVACFCVSNLFAQDASDSENSDWPQILGANRNGVLADSVTLGWQKTPDVIWETEIGEGFSGPVIVDDELILFHRPDGARGKFLIVEKFNVTDGRSVWKQKIASQYRGAMDGDAGPKATPVIQDGFVYCYGPDGELACLEFDTGKIVWELNARKKFNASEGYFGCGSSPLVVDGKVLLNVGGRKGASVVAFDASDGEVLWKAIDDEASYSSPIVVEHDGKKMAVFLTRTRFVGLDVDSGKVLFSNSFGKRGPTAVASMPVAFGSKLFANAAYRVGATVVDLKNLKTAGDEIAPDWSSENAFASHYGTPVFFNGHFYGTSGREDMRNGSFRCLEASTGDVKWDQDSFPVAHTLLIGEQLLVLDYEGKLSLIEPSPAGFQQIQSATIFNGPTRSIPAFSDGKLFFRSNAKSRVGKLVAIDVSEK